jgi:hypothetical protein
VEVATSFPHPHTSRYTLRCRPTGGTLPLAARVCGDIARHPAAMLTPRRPRSVCDQPPGAPEVTVESRWNGRSFRYSDSPGCDWPRGTETGIYYAAATGVLRALARYERTLRCDDDPALFAKPPRWASIAACVHGLWTPRTERLIRDAARVLRPLGVAFPRDIGARPCAIPRGGPFRRRRLAGTCGVNVRRVWSRPVVTFVEAFPNGGREQRHVWRVGVSGDRARVLLQSGPPPPQYW